MNFNDCTIASRPAFKSITGQSGLNFTIQENGSVHGIRHEGIQVNLFKGSLLQQSCSNIYLRIRSDEIIAVPLMGPKSNSEHYIADDFFASKGCVGDISYSCRLILSDSSPVWRWQIDLECTAGKAVEVDLVYAQDVGLITADNGPDNEFYISQYIDHTPLQSSLYGHIICCRQNELAGRQIPWLALGSTAKVDSFLTDGLQFFGTEYRSGSVPKSLSMPAFTGLCQKETSVIALAQKPFTLKPNQLVQSSFFGVYCSDHPDKTTHTDIDFIHSCLDSTEVTDCPTFPSEFVGARSCGSIFTESDFFTSEDLSHEDIASLFTDDMRHAEWSNGKLLSFFYDDNKHVVLKDKELMVERPHGHIMQSGSLQVLQNSVMCTTAYMFGVFNSQVCQGNVNFNRFIAVNKNAFNMPRFSGQRIFIKENGSYYQLAVSSAFEIGMNKCRWIYKRNDLIFEVVSEAAADCDELRLHLRVINGNAIEWLISNELEESNGWKPSDSFSEFPQAGSISFEPAPDSELSKLYPGGYFHFCFDDKQSVKQVGGDELLFVDKKSRGLSMFVLQVDRVKDFTLRLRGQLTTQSDNICQQDITVEDVNAATSFNMSLPSKTNSEQMDEILEMLPWLCHNGRVHYLTPHGLEQYGGAAWGTRDICQGPLEMLLSTGNYSQAKQILRKVFSNQDTDGNWPQWWMFDEYHHIRCDESHGDVIFWPILALSDYLTATQDYEFLQEPLPFYCDSQIGQVPTCSLIDHVLRCLDHIERYRYTNGTSLVNYSDGDWNDSLQPADPGLKQKLISSWTVALSYQVFGEFAKVCKLSGNGKLAEKLTARQERIKQDFNTYLVKDKVVAGFGYLKDHDSMDLLLHPDDKTTSIHYRLLPMIRGVISEIFTPAQAKHHLGLIDKYLKGPDGARLMDKPPQYDGGLKTFFKRAESSPFFGREIGLMYTHAHLRYCQALAKMGCGDDLLHALRQIIPINLNSVVPMASVRQSNCYYSSSDADFANRYEVDNNYDKINSGQIAFNGGWRIYSSGPGIVVRLVLSHLLGLRHSFGSIVLDPVLPKSVDGLTVDLNLCGRNMTVEYHIKDKGFGVSRVLINKTECEFDREQNPYRLGGAMIETQKLISLLKDTGNRMEIFV